MSDIATIAAGKLPAHIAKMFGALDGNSSLSAGVSKAFPVLSYKGKTWALNENKTRTPILNADGDPAPSIGVVILKANPGISKIYYEKRFEDGDEAKPDCYSVDGVAPAPDAVKPQCKKCALCPHNQFGSRITDSGSKAKACSDSRRLAVAPMEDLSKPIMLRVPATSLKDLATYGEMLQGRKVPHACVVTRIRFDPDAAYPKMQFSAVKLLDEEALEQVTQTLRDPLIDHIVGTLAGEYEADVGEPVAEPTPTKAAKAQPVEQPVAEPEVVEAEIVEPTPKATKPKAQVKTTSSAELFADIDAFMSGDDEGE